MAVSTDQNYLHIVEFGFVVIVVVIVVVPIVVLAPRKLYVN